MKAKEAVDWVDASAWRAVPASERLVLLLELLGRIGPHVDEFRQADAAMKQISLDDPANVHQASLCAQATVVPIANNIAAAIELYQQLVDGKLLQPVAVTSVGGDLYDIQVSPRGPMEAAMYGTRKDFLRVKGQPVQTHPLDKAGGIIAVLGAGNYSSAFEVIRALFIDNCVVVHKPHHINAESDKVWEKVLQPLVDRHALAFCDADEGRALVADPRLTKIYFTGGTAAAKAIMASTKAEFVSECGGNNPCLIVPGDRPWTPEEIAHQAIHLASWGKSNGGAVCGRAQTVVTCKNWPQRGEFLDALRKALRDDTPGMTTYYPGADKTFAAFRAAYPNAELIQPEGGKMSHSDFLLITDVAQDGYAVTHEAFCQVIDEVPLDTAPNAAAFLPVAVAFANDQLLGTLGACILVDEDTLATHGKQVDQAVTDLCYGAVAVNTMPPNAWMNPALTWGGNEEGQELASGRGNFGNLLSFENAEKAIVRDAFMSPSHLLITNKHAFAAVGDAVVNFSVAPTVENLMQIGAAAQAGAAMPKDF